MQMINQKSAIVIAVVLVLATTSVTQQVYAKNAGEAGYAQGKNDKQDGQDHNPRCPDGLTDVQCTAYRVGYESGWTATSIIRPDSEPQRDFNFDRDEQQSSDDGEFEDN